MKSASLNVKRAYTDVVALLKQNQARISEILDAIERRDISATEVRESLNGVAVSLRDARKKISNEREFRGDRT